MKANYYINGKTVSVEIEESKAIFSEKELEKMTKKFNKDTKVAEFVNSTTYYIDYRDPKGKFSYHRLKSCSLDELFEMYKNAWKGMKIQERKCTMFIKS